MLQVDPRKHRLLLEVFDENRLVNLFKYIYYASFLMSVYTLFDISNNMNKGLTQVKDGF